MSYKWRLPIYFGVAEPQCQKILVIISVVVSDYLLEDRRVLGISGFNGRCFLSCWASFSQKLVKFCRNESFFGSVVPYSQTRTTQWRIIMTRSKPNKGKNPSSKPSAASKMYCKVCKSADGGPVDHHCLFADTKKVVAYVLANNLMADI